MKIQGEHHFQAPREKVWQAVLDPKILSSSLPGFQRLDSIGEHEYEGALEIKVGPVQGDFQGTLKLSDLKAPSSYRFRLNGMGAAGFIDGEGLLVLEESGGGTRLHYDLDAKIGGRVAGVGQRLLDSSAKVLARQTLEGLEQQVLAAPAESAETAKVTEPTEPSELSELSERSERSEPMEPSQPAQPAETGAPDSGGVADLSTDTVAEAPAAAPPAAAPKAAPDAAPAGSPAVSPTAPTSPDTPLDGRAASEPAAAASPPPSSPTSRIAGSASASAPSQAKFAFTFAKGLAGELVPPARRPWVISAALLAYTVIVILLTRACSG